MMNKKIITILIIILVIAIIAGGFWYTKNQKNTTKPVDVIKDVQDNVEQKENGIVSENDEQQEQLIQIIGAFLKNEVIPFYKENTQEIIVDVDISSWNVYESEEAGISFMYPNNLKVVSNDGLEGVIINVYSKDSDNMILDMISVSLNDIEVEGKLTENHLKNVYGLNKKSVTQSLGYIDLGEYFYRVKRMENKIRINGTKIDDLGDSCRVMQIEFKPQNLNSDVGYAIVNTLNF